MVAAAGVAAAGVAAAGVAAAPGFAGCAAGAGAGFVAAAGVAGVAAGAGAGVGGCAGAAGVGDVGGGVVDGGATTWVGGEPTARPPLCAEIWLDPTSSAAAETNKKVFGMDSSLRGAPSLDDA